MEIISSFIDLEVSDDYKTKKIQRKWYESSLTLLRKQEVRGYNK